ncbi:MAG: SCO family protein [Rhodobacter sp.]|nr:SCO family protein [Rhodobacter sp.]
MIKVYAAAAAAAVAALLAGTWWMTLGRSSDDAFSACRNSAIAGGAGSIGGPFTLVDGTGQTVTDADVFTKPSLVYFGYTFCPDVCPLDNVRNAEAIDLLDGMGYDAQPVFISIDPERDTPEVVEEFAGYMHEKMIGLTGSLDQVTAASKAYRTYFRKQDSDDPDYYLVDHSTFTYLVLPGTGFVEFFKRGDTAPDIARRTACFVEAS